MEAYWRFASLIVGLATVSAIGGASSAASTAEANCADLVRTALPHGQVTGATVETVGSASVCRVLVTSRPTPASDIRIEVWIPQGDAWNGKFVQAGNGGYAGRIPSEQLKQLAARGYAAAATDDGHQSASSTDGSWAFRNPEKLIDFGWRALKQTTDVSKALIVADKGSDPSKSYFDGCSDGGREALMEAQRYPDDFDGIAAGAPGNYQALLMTMRLGMFETVMRPGGFLDQPELQLAQSASLADCGGTDEGFVRDAANCHFDPSKLLCKEGQTGQCLTAAQVASLRAIYAGWHDPRTGILKYPGYEPGSEAQPAWTAAILGSNALDPEGSSAGYQFAASYLRYFVVGDPNFDVSKFDIGAQAEAGVAKLAPILDAEDPNLSAFKRHGGKLIQYHGWNDQNVPPRSSIRYYEDVLHTMGDPKDFYRLFMIPGMLHCGGGMGPNLVDWLGVLDDWVTTGRAPNSVTAMPNARGTLISKEGPLHPAQTQLVCPYPQTPKLVGSNASVATSYRCEALTSKNGL